MVKEYGNLTYNLIKKVDYYEFRVAVGSGGSNERTGESSRTSCSLSRARRNINEILTLNLELYHSMITLTYKENMQDYDRATYDFRGFIRRLGNPQYLAVRELQKRGAIHYHIIIFKQLTEVEIAKAWRLGRTDLQLIEDLDINRITNYFAKYISNKEKGQLIDTNKRLYNVSQGVKRYKRIKTDSDILPIFEKYAQAKIEKQGYTKYIIGIEELEKLQIIKEF